MLEGTSLVSGVRCGVDIQGRLSGCGRMHYLKARFFGKAIVLPQAALDV